MQGNRLQVLHKLLKGLDSIGNSRKNRISYGFYINHTRDWISGLTLSMRENRLQFTRVGNETKRERENKSVRVGEHV